MPPRTGTAHPELGASTVAADMRTAESALVVSVVVIAISLRLKTSVMVGLDLQEDYFRRAESVYPTLVGIGHDPTLVGIGAYLSRYC